MERKLATVVFVDLVDSTGLVARADPEVVRRRVTRFFEQVSHCIETHGGKVEKFAGDAVMAAFGIPQAHEDDAERAVRAALVDPRRRSASSGSRRAWASSPARSSPTSSDSTFATGEAVNVAARLQQEAEAGPDPARPRHPPADARPGRGRGSRADRAARARAPDLDVGRRRRQRPAGGARAVEAPFVGREAEQELLENTFARAVRDRRAHLFTVYGEPGVGKTRLGQEFLSGLEGATVLSGRALPYGESITYWPLAEMVKASADIADDDPLDVAIEKLRACCPAEAVADLLGLASGVLEAVHGERSQQEIAWAAREWAELMAGVQPLVLVFEDIHWAEEPLLDLIEHLASWVREAPLLILCLSRPELLDVRPEWGGGRVRATAIELEPLGSAESEELADALLDAGAGPIDEGMRRILLEKTEGNPLFLEETVRMLAENGGGSAEQIPDTVQALIAARIDRLGPQARTLLQRASVIGRTFWGGAIAHLSPEIEDVECVLDDLLAARLRRARVALDDHGRERLPLQARPDPRGRLRRPGQGVAGRAPPPLRRLAAASGPATSCSRSAPSTSTTRARCSPSWTARRRPTSRPAPPRCSSRPAAARSRARRTARRGTCCCARSSSSRRSSAAGSPRARPPGWATGSPFRRR